MQVRPVKQNSSQFNFQYKIKANSFNWLHFNQLAPMFEVPKVTVLS